LYVETDPDPLDDFESILREFYKSSSSFSLKNGKIAGDSPDPKDPPDPKDYQGKPIPAEYSSEDPLGLKNKQAVIDAFDCEPIWRKYKLEVPEERAKLHQIFRNAISAAILSANAELGQNAQNFQWLQDIPEEIENNPGAILQMHTEKFNAYNQEMLRTRGKDNFQKAKAISLPIAKSLSRMNKDLDKWIQIALDDETGGLEWREAARIGYSENEGEGGIAGLGPKTASFAWLILAPNTSQVATIDRHIIKFLINSPIKIPKKYQNEKKYPNLQKRIQDTLLSPDDKQYDIYEEQIKILRDQLYPETPLGKFQWALWDWYRSFGRHQNHNMLKVIKPEAYNEVLVQGRDIAKQFLSIDQQNSLKEEEMKGDVNQRIKCPECQSPSPQVDNVIYKCINHACTFNKFNISKIINFI
jgi:hypothetical protein